MFISFSQGEYFILKFFGFVYKDVKGKVVKRGLEFRI